LVLLLLVLLVVLFLVLSADTGVLLGEAR